MGMVVGEEVSGSEEEADWQGPLFGEVRWGDLAPDVREKLQHLGEPIQGDRGPGQTLTYLSPDYSHGVVLLFDNAGRLIEAQLTRQVPGSDCQGV